MIKPKETYVVLLVRELHRFATEKEAQVFRKKFGKKIDEIVIIRTKESK